MEVNSVQARAGHRLSACSAQAHSGFLVVPARGVFSAFGMLALGQRHPGRVESEYFMRNVGLGWLGGNP